MDNIEDIYYNKYLKYKYKYLELKGNGLAEIIRKSIEEKFYGPELLKEIESITEKNDIDGMIWSSLYTRIVTGDKKVYQINMINNFEISLINILEKISKKILEKTSKKEEPTELSTDLRLVLIDINLIIDKINNNKIQESNLRMTNYSDIEIFINDVFEKHTLLSKFSKILKKLFNIYFKLIKKVIKKIKEQQK
jgi:hypothetical protein